MIDFHAHILPGLDDGPENMGQALAMARIALQDGITTVVATPHTHNGEYINNRAGILAACQGFKKALDENALALNVIPGSEVHLCPEIMDALESGDIMTLNDQGDLLLLELPHPFVPKGVASFIGCLRAKGFTPIVAHAERLPMVQQNASALAMLLEAGALCQVTAGSLEGFFGKAARNCCKALLADGMAHCMGSDAHDSVHRPPRLGAAASLVEKMMGKEVATDLVNGLANRFIHF